MLKRIFLGVLLVLLLIAPVHASLFDYYQEQNKTLPTIKQRQELASSFGIGSYTGTKDQNILLESLLRNPTDRKLGVYTPVTGYESRTTQSLTAAATTIPVVSTLDKSGNQISLSNISSAATVKVYLNIEPGLPKEEPIVCTGISATSWTNCTRGLAFQGSSETSSSTLAQVHNAGSKIIISNVGQFHNQYVSVDGAQTINDVKTFSSIPLIPTTTPTNPASVVSLALLASTSFSGVVDATTGTPGKVQIATAAQAAASAPANSGGSTAYYVIPTTITTSTPNGTSTTNFIPVTGVLGTLNKNFIDQTAAYTWSGAAVFSATTTFNGQASFTSTNTFSGSNYFTGTSTLATTTFTIEPTLPTTTQSSASTSLNAATLGYVNKNIALAFGSFTKNLADSTGLTTTISPGLGKVPKLIVFSCINDPRNLTRGQYNGTTVGCFTTNDNNANGTASGCGAYVGSPVIEATLSGSANNGQGAVPSVSGNNIVLTWTKSNTPTGNLYCQWEAF